LIEPGQDRPRLRELAEDGAFFAFAVDDRGNPLPLDALTLPADHSASATLAGARGDEQQVVMRGPVTADMLQWAADTNPASARNLERAQSWWRLTGAPWPVEFGPVHGKEAISRFLESGGPRVAKETTAIVVSIDGDTVGAWLVGARVDANTVEPQVYFPDGTARPLAEVDMGEPHQLYMYAHTGGKTSWGGAESQQPRPDLFTVNPDSPDAPPRYGDGLSLGLRDVLAFGSNRERVEEALAAVHGDLSAIRDSDAFRADFVSVDPSAVHEVLRGLAEDSAVAVVVRDWIDHWNRRYLDAWAVTSEDIASGTLPQLHDLSRPGGYYLYAADHSGEPISIELLNPPPYGRSWSVPLRRFPISAEMVDAANKQFDPAQRTTTPREFSRVNLELVKRQWQEPERAQQSSWPARFDPVYDLDRIEFLLNGRERSSFLPEFHSTRAVVLSVTGQTRAWILTRRPFSRGIDVFFADGSDAHGTSRKVQQLADVAEIVNANDLYWYAERGGRTLAGSLVPAHPASLRRIGTSIDLAWALDRSSGGDTATYLLNRISHGPDAVPFYDDHTLDFVTNNRYALIKVLEHLADEAFQQRTGFALAVIARVTTNPWAASADVLTMTRGEPVPNPHDLGSGRFYLYAVDSEGNQIPRALLVPPPSYADTIAEQPPASESGAR